jgi:hypothetical protein
VSALPSPSLRAPCKGLAAPRSIMLVRMLSPGTSDAAWAADMLECTAETLAVACLCDSRGATALPPELLDAVLVLALLVDASAAAEASSPETVGGRGVSGSAKGVQSGGPASKGEDLARPKLLADPACPVLLGEVLLLESLLLPGSDPLDSASAAAFAKRVRSCPAAFWCCCRDGLDNAKREVVGAAVPGTAAAGKTPAIALLLVARLQPSLWRFRLSVK